MGPRICHVEGTTERQHGRDAQASKDAEHHAVPTISALHDHQQHQTLTAAAAAAAAAQSQSEARAIPAALIARVLPHQAWPGMPFAKESEEQADMRSRAHVGEAHDARHPQHSYEQGHHTPLQSFRRSLDGGSSHSSGKRTVSSDSSGVETPASRASSAMLTGKPSQSP